MSGPGHGHGAAGGPPPFPEPRSFPRITEIGILSMICVIVGVIVMAAKLPGRPPLGLPVGLVVAARSRRRTR